MISSIDSKLNREKQSQMHNGSEDGKHHKLSEDSKPIEFT